LLAAHGVGRGDEFVAMAPGASNGNAKQWPPSRYAELASLVAKRTPSTVVVIGTSGDIGAARDIERALESPPAGLRLVNLAGRTSLDELMGVLSRSERLVTNDSGAMHLASALGRKVVAIFGATDEHATAPIAWTGTDAVHEIVTGEAWCRPCLLHDCPTDHRCMTSISAAAVAARLDEPKPAGARLVR
jgi:heptosyltransferase-2